MNQLLKIENTVDNDYGGLKKYKKNLNLNLIFLIF